jgi:hypothetical protein
MTEDPKAIETIKKTYSALVEFLSGIASSDRKDWALSIGYLLQRVRGGEFLNQLLEKIQKYREKGKIKADYLSTSQCLNCLQEVLNFIDQDSPDEVRFNAMKKRVSNGSTGRKINTQ